MDSFAGHQVATKPRRDDRPPALDDRPLPASSPGPGGRRRRKQFLQPSLLYILPTFLVFAIFVLIPLIQTFWYSLYDWNGVTAGTWVGLQNYLDIAQDARVLASFGHVITLIAFFSLLPVAVGLTLAAVLGHSRRIFGLSFFRTVLFLPQVVASAVVATTWLGIYSPDGSINGVLRRVGLEELTNSWLGDFNTALPAIGAVGTWAGIGLCMVLFLAGISQIPYELYEAAQLDGAGRVREFFAVTLPGVQSQLTVALILTTINALRAFDLVYLTTDGGPGTATETPALLVYQKAFLVGEVGAASALGIVLTVVMLAVVLVIARVSARSEV